MSKDTNSLNNALNRKQGKYSKFKAEIQSYETVINTESIEPKRIVFVANHILIINENGNKRYTGQGTAYKVNIENGVISFDKPLKFIE